jgi:hypothetical protein
VPAAAGQTEKLISAQADLKSSQRCIVLALTPGEVVEWFMALVLKTSVSSRAPWVRIPPSPLIETTANLDDWFPQKIKLTVASTWLDLALANHADVPR